MRRRSLAALRKEVEPVPPAALARFLPAWQGVGGRRRPRGVDGLLRAVEQLAGAPVPACALETLVLPARVADYSPALLDELTAAGEVIWAGAGALPGNDGWLALAPADVAELLLPAPATLELADPAPAVLAALDGDQALFFRDAVRPGRLDRRRRAGRGALGAGVGRAAHQRHAGAAAALLGGGRGRATAPAPARPAPRYGRCGRAGRRCPPGPARRPRPAGGRSPAARARPDPALARAEPRCCSTGTAC